MIVGKSFQQFLESQNIATDYSESLASTNDKAKEHAFTETQPLKVYITDQQTAGRGRNTNTWISPKTGSSLMCSFSFALNKAPQAVTSPVFGLALHQASELSFPKLELSLKAPNDLYLKGQKVAGLLIETLQMGAQVRLIVGLGLNIFDKPELDNCNYLNETALINEPLLNLLFTQLINSFSEAAQFCLMPHLTEPQRKALLLALNKNTSLQEKYSEVSPLGDLVTGSKTISWKDL